MRYRWGLVWAALGVVGAGGPGCGVATPPTGWRVAQVGRLAPSRPVTVGQQLILDGKPVDVIAEREVTPNWITRPPGLAPEAVAGKYDVEVVLLGKVPALKPGFGQQIEVNGVSVILRLDPDGSGEATRIWAAQNREPEALHLNLTDTDHGLSGQVSGTLTGLGDAAGEVKRFVYRFAQPYTHHPERPAIPLRPTAPARGGPGQQGPAYSPWGPDYRLAR